jgi:hypothetical protein
MLPHAGLHLGKLPVCVAIKRVAQCSQMNLAQAEPADIPCLARCILYTLIQYPSLTRGCRLRLDTRLYPNLAL